MTIHLLQDAHSAMCKNRLSIDGSIHAGPQKLPSEVLAEGIRKSRHKLREYLASTPQMFFHLPTTASEAETETRNVVSTGPGEPHRRMLPVWGLRR